MKRWLVLLLVCVCVAACDDATGPERGIPREFAFGDPVGDTAAFAGSVDTFPALDVRRVSGVVSDDSLVFTMEFTDLIAPAGDDAPNSFVALLGVDADDDGRTGAEAILDPFPSTSDAGVEYWIFVDPASNSNAEVQTVTQKTVGIFPASYGATSITMRIPLSAIGLRRGERFRVVGVIGTLQRFTDLIPNSASYVIMGSDIGGSE